MKRAVQLALLERIEAHRTAGRSTDVAPSTMTVPVDDYTGLMRWEAERTLLATQPQLIALSGLLPEPGSFATITVANRPVVVTRSADGEAHALLNVCRHRGAPVASGCGSARRLTCGYHGWSYHLDGRNAARRGEPYFDDIDPVGLTPLPVHESHGYIWVTADPAGATIDDSVFDGIETELFDFDAASFRHFASTTFNRRLNWKLAVDTFAEAWHVPILHRDSLAPMIHGDFSIFDPFGRHGRMIATRRSIELADPTAEQPLLPHATTLYFMHPNTVLIFQQDHFQLYRSSPGATPDEAELSVSLYVPTDTERDDRYWQRNFDLLVEVTDTEDFSTAVAMQQGFHSGAQEHVTYGRNEPALQHVHRSLDAALREHSARSAVGYSRYGNDDQGIRDESTPISAPFGVVALDDELRRGPHHRITE